MDAQEMRPPLASFANYMEAVLKENDYKNGWGSETLADLFCCLQTQVDDLGLAMPMGQTHLIRKECADVANFAMMIYDKITAAPDEIVGVDI